MAKREGRISERLGAALARSACAVTGAAFATFLSIPTLFAAPPTIARAEPEPSKSGEARSAPTPAPSDKPKAAEWENAPYTRRGGFSVGLGGGIALAMTSGFPNDAKKIGLERYYTETGVGIGSGGSFWIAGALTDWFTFGIGMQGGGFSTSDVEEGAGAFVFHVEAFPLFPLGGHFRDLGALLETGAGGGSVMRPDDDTKLVESGGASLIGAGVFYEGIRFWKISTGPMVMGTYLWSESMRRGSVLLGWRTALYTKP